MAMWKKALLGVVALLVFLVIGFVAYVQMNWDKVYEVPVKDIKASTDPEVIKRGEYLVRGPAHCQNCHQATFADMKRADAGENLPLKGGAIFPMGPLGSMAPSNLTPDKETGIGRFTDWQLYRTMRHAIKPDGTATIAMMMPFWNMADEDIIAIISYLRSTEPVKNEVPGPSYTFMGKALRVFMKPFHPILDPTPPAKAPPMAATKERGEYLAKYVANCKACHTKADPATMEFLGPEFGGGAEIEPMPLPGVDQTQWFHTPNLTSHEKGVLKNFPTAESFIARFRAGRAHPGSAMHWGPFSRMSDEDISAIWLFLKSLPPADFDPGPVTFTKE
jgi:mono/diheme cytochrome c family protein